MDGRKRWTPAEDDILREQWGKMPTLELSRQLGKTPMALLHRARNLKIRHLRFWTDEELQAIREQWGKVKTSDLARQLGRSMSSLKQKAIKLGLDAEKCYTPEELQLVREMYPTHTAAQIAARIFGNPRCALAIFRMARKLGLRKWPKIPPEVDAQVAELHAAGKVIREIAAAMGLQYNQVKYIQRKLKLPTILDMDAKRRSIKKQFQTLGVKNGGELRQYAIRKYAASYGWPEDLRARQVQILECLLAGGPMTRRQICTAIGAKWRGAVKSLVGNVPGGTYLTDLIHRGLVEKTAGRLVKGPTRGGSVHLYFATPYAEDLKREWQETVGAESGGGDQGLANGAAASSL